MVIPSGAQRSRGIPEWLPYKLSTGTLNFTRDDRITRELKQRCYLALFQHRSQLLRTGNVVPLRPQFTSSPKNEDRKISCWLSQLRSYCSVKIGHHKYVATRIARDLLCVIPRLKPFCLLTNTVPDECSRDPPSDCQVSSGEMDDGDHSVIRIAQTVIRNPITHGARLWPLRRRRQHDDRHVSISGGKFVSIDIDKTD